MSHGRYMSFRDPTLIHHSRELTSGCGAFFYSPPLPHRFATCASAAALRTNSRGARRETPRWTRTSARSAPSFATSCAAKVSFARATLGATSPRQRCLRVDVADHFVITVFCAVSVLVRPPPASLCAASPSHHGVLRPPLCCSVLLLQSGAARRRPRLRPR